MFEEVNFMPRTKTPNIIGGGFRLSLPDFKKGVSKQRPSKKVGFKTNYFPSIEALYFNVKGKKPSVEELKTGLGLRPIIS